MTRKTPPEILTDFGCPEIPNDENVIMYYPAIISAMQEFADQESRRIAFEFADWYLVSIQTPQVTDAFGSKISRDIFWDEFLHSEKDDPIKT